MADAASEPILSQDEQDMAEQAVGTPPRVEAIKRQTSQEERGRSASQGSIGKGRSGSFTAGRVVLLAIDPSDNAKNAFDYYESYLRREDDLVILAHCPEPPSLPSFRFKSGISPPIEEWKRVMDDLNTRSRKLEEDYEQTCIINKWRYKVRDMMSNSPGEGIIRIAEDEGASLIVMGSRGLNFLRRALLGSVSEYVCHHSGIPTLIVPPPKRHRRRSQRLSVDLT